jgi:WD40 repeat protein/nucleoside phosphorylase
MSTAVSLFVAEPATEGSTPTHAAPMRVDVLILTALQDELDAVLALGEGGRGRWQESRDGQGFRCYRRDVENGRGGRLTLAAAWTGEMGPHTAAVRAQQLIGELDAACLAMCGICAGYRKKVALGDVILADQLYRYDEGKVVTPEGKPSEVFHTLRTFDLPATWKMDAAFLSRELDRSKLSLARPRSRAVQRRWLLSALLTQEEAGGTAPASHPERKSRCPDWTDLVRETQKAGLVALQGGRLSLTPAGREEAQNDQILHVDGLPDDPPLQVHVGAIATGAAVQEDPALFERLRRVVRTTIGAEMEGAAIGDVAARFKRQMIVVKAVSDHADPDKDDSFREFACRASAEVLLAFLRKHLDPRAEPTEPLPAGDEDADGEEADDRSARFELHGARDRDGGLLARVERVALVRDPTAKVTRHRAPAPFAGVLEVAVQDGELVDLRVIAAIEQSITKELVDQYQAEVEGRFRQQDPLLRSMLVHGGPSAPSELARAAYTSGVVLKSFGEYQRLFDFGPYLDKQTGRLDTDPVYPPLLYVEQPARWSLAGGREEQATENALTTLWELLEAPHPRFALVLGDFGAGKTFLLHELARRMARDKHPLVPVLVEMSKLQKQPTLKALLAQHFANADVGRIDLDAFQYLLGEGRIALLFDGFDELALRLTYDRALEHFETVTAAAQGNAKVVVTSRTQHFLTDHQVRRAMAERAEQVPGYRLFTLEKFGEGQIRRFLGNLIKEPGQVEERYRLLDEVKDLLGLAENPRMLGFIAKIEPQKLREAKEKSGEITAAKLYEILVDQWLGFEHDRANPPGAPKGIGRGKLRELVDALAALFWDRRARMLGIGEMREVLSAEGIEPAVVEHMVGSGSLLVRDGEGRFSFVHRSVMEWLVAAGAAREVGDKGDAGALGADEMSALMADFFVSLAGVQRAERWAHERGGTAAEGHAKKNAARVLERIGLRGRRDDALPSTVNLEGQDLRGQDYSRADLRRVNLARADLRGVTLVEADLRGALLTDANLERANLEKARLGGANLKRADLSFARLSGADLSGVQNLALAQTRGVKLVGATGLANVSLVGIGGAPPMPEKVEPMWAPSARCHAVAWSPLGDLVVSGHEDGSVRLLDTVSGHLIRKISGHAGAVRCVAFSSDGFTLASVADDNMVRLWSLSSGRPLHAFGGNKSGARCVVFSPDGLSLACGGIDDAVRLWEVSSGRVIRAFEGHKKVVRSAVFSRDGLFLASGSSDSTLRLWDVPSGRFLRAFEGHDYAVHSVAFSPDGLTLASGSSDNTVRLWDVSSGGALGVIEGHTSSVEQIAFSPDGLSLASASADTTVCLWDVRSGHLLRTFTGHKNVVSSVAFSADGRIIASGALDRTTTVSLWDVASGRCLRSFGGLNHAVGSVAFSPKGRVIASGASDNSICLWDVASGRARRVLRGYAAAAVWCVAFSRDGRAIATGCSDNTVRAWNVTSGRPMRAFKGHKSAVRSVVFSPDGLSLASGAQDNVVRLWDVASGRAVRTFKGHASEVWSVALSNDGLTLASGSSDNTVRLWDVASGQVLHVLEGHNYAVHSVAFSSDGFAIASGSSDNTVRLWDATSGRHLRTLAGHRSAVLCVAFGALNLAVASGSGDNTVRLWDALHGSLLNVFEGHTHAVRSVAFSPDDKTLASASEDGTIRLWDVATARCLAILLATPEGWAAFTPDGRYKIGGDIAGSFWHVIGLCRFEPGELDPYLPHLRIPDDAPLISLPPAERPGEPPAGGRP